MTSITVSESTKDKGVSCFFYSQKQMNLMGNQKNNPRFKGIVYTEMRCISHGLKNNFDDCILIGIGTINDISNMDELFNSTNLNTKG
jgi:hypothetical protein